MAVIECSAVGQIEYSRAGSGISPHSRNNGTAGLKSTIHLSYLLLRIFTDVSFFICLMIIDDYCMGEDGDKEL